MLGALTVGILATTAGSALSQTSTQTYIVQMLEAPAVAYDGGVSGIPATKPGKGNKINPAADNVQKYRAYLKGKHDKAAPERRRRHDRLRLRRLLQRLRREADGGAGRGDAPPEGRRRSHARRARSGRHILDPAFLGLTANGGLWDQLGGVSKGGLQQGRRRGHHHRRRRLRHLAGEQVFSDRKLRRLERQHYPHKVTGFHGNLPGGRAVHERSTATTSSSAPGTSTPHGAATPASRRCGRGSSSRRATTTATGRTQRRRPAATSASSRRVTRCRVRRDQRDGAARPHLRVQGALVDAGRLDRERLHARPRGRDRPGRRGRRRRHQLLDQRDDDSNFLDPVEVSFLFAADAGVFVVRVRRQQRARLRARSLIRARGSRPSRRARTTATVAAR